MRNLSNTFHNMFSLLAILFLFTFIFALLGSQIFGGKFPPASRSHFDSPWDAYVTVVQVITQRL